MSLKKRIAKIADFCRSRVWQIKMLYASSTEEVEVIKKQYENDPNCMVIITLI
jgi:hypothetical protein